MRAIVFDRPGPPAVLRVAELADPVAGPGEIVVRNFAAALNRADLLQRRGLYPPPPGASEILGLEFAGEVEALGPGVAAPAVGERVFGLVAGGAYAERVRVPAALAVPIPDNLSYEAAAAAPEAFSVAQEALLVLGGLAAGQTALIHGGASGVGTAAIQVARRRGATVIVTAGSPEKLARAAALGACHGIDYRREDFAARVGEITGGAGVDVILDVVGAASWARNIDSLRAGGRLIVVGLLGGARVEADLGRILMRRLRILGMALRGLPLADKIAMAERFRADILPDLASGALRPVVDRVFHFEDVRAAHERMESNANVGKIVLRM